MPWFQLILSTFIILFKKKTLQFKCQSEYSKLYIKKKLDLNRYNGYLLK